MISKDKFSAMMNDLTKEHAVTICALSDGKTQFYTHVDGDYYDAIFSIAVLLMDMHTGGDVTLEDIGKDLNRAVEILKEEQEQNET